MNSLSSGGGGAGGGAGNSRRQSLRLQGEGEVQGDVQVERQVQVQDEDREISVVDVLRAYERAAEGVKTAREVMVSFPFPFPCWGGGGGGGGNCVGWLWCIFTDIFSFLTEMGGTLDPGGGRAD